MRALQAATGETVTISARVPGGRVYLDQIESTREIKMTVELGRRFPLHAGSSSRSILAFLPASERREFLDQHELEALTPKTITDRSDLAARLEDVRATGAAQSDGERQHGAGSVASPIFGFDGQVIGAISVCGPAYRMSADVRSSTVPLVREAADQISRALGWRGGLPVDEKRDAS
jgi:DNA-binding IclR family transcriptional regulator